MRFISVDFLFEVSLQVTAHTFKSGKCDGHSPLLTIHSSKTSHRYMLNFLWFLLVHWTHTQRMLTTDWS